MSETRERPPRPPGEEERTPEDIRERPSSASRAARNGTEPTESSPKQRTAEVSLAKSDVAMVEKVIRRATRLQLAKSAGEPGRAEGLTDVEVLRIGEELGLDPDNVRQALLEVRTERLRPRRKQETGLAARLFGKKLVRASRSVPLPAEEAQRLLEEHLSNKESLAEVRRSAGSSLWVPAGGLVSKLQRGLNLGRRAYILSKAEEISLSVASIDEENCLITLSASIGNLRREKATGWSIGTPFMFAPAVVVLILLGLPAEAAILLGAGGAGTTAVSATRVAVKNQRREMQTALTGLLDRLAAGVPLEEPRGSLQDILLK